MADGSTRLRGGSLGDAEPRARPSASGEERRKQRSAREDGRGRDAQRCFGPQRLALDVLRAFREDVGRASAGANRGRERALLSGERQDGYEQSQEPQPRRAQAPLTASDSEGHWARAHPWIRSTFAGITQTPSRSKH